VQSLSVAGGVAANATRSKLAKQRLADPHAPPPAYEAVAAAGEVEFRPGAESSSPLLGNGTIALDETGVRLAGARAPATLPVIVGCAVGVMGVVLAAVISSSMNLDLQGRGGRKLGLLVAFGAGIGPSHAEYGF